MSSEISTQELERTLWNIGKIAEAIRTGALPHTHLSTISQAAETARLKIVREQIAASAARPVSQVIVDRLAAVPLLVAQAVRGCR